MGRPEIGLRRSQCSLHVHMHRRYMWVQAGLKGTPVEGEDFGAGDGAVALK